jgi:hypothetical protein
MLRKGEACRPYFSINRRQRLINRDNPPFFLVAAFEFEPASLQRSGGNRHPKRDADQVRIVELNAGAFIPVIIQGLQTGFTQDLVKRLSCCFSRPILARSRAPGAPGKAPQRPARSGRLIMVFLGDAGHQAAHTNPIGPHNDRLGLTRLIQEGCPHVIGVA